jgi:hypothetical protein
MDLPALVTQVGSMYAGSQDQVAFLNLLEMFPDDLLQDEYAKRGLGVHEYKGLPPSGGGGALAGSGLGPMTTATTTTAGAGGAVHMHMPQQMPNLSQGSMFGSAISSSSTDSTTTTTTAATVVDPLAVHVPPQSPPGLTPPLPTTIAQALPQLPPLSALNSSSYVAPTATAADSVAVHLSQTPASGELPAIPDILDNSSESKNS